MQLFVIGEQSYVWARRPRVMVGRPRVVAGLDPAISTGNAQRACELPCRVTTASGTMPRHMAWPGPAMTKGGMSGGTTGCMGRGASEDGPGTSGTGKHRVSNISIAADACVHGITRAVRLGPDIFPFPFPALRD